ncbi:hypothetical protein Nepgr_005719 [Nepenthes gracilis]|uniref:Uncharacterized protein n=1 Tax=Nepenthes gracilis TaxID=150966 RepID=A0AAD3S3P6_NEPGR|nr:hypothetical protein Nepgr_005719 [Nepenthes gracilis]
MDAKKSNKIREIVRLQQILRKWKKFANASKNGSSGNTGSKGIKFLKKTLSFSDNSVSSVPSNNNDAIPKGFLAVCVGNELKRYVIPTEYLRHQAFGILLREAEEEFGFHQEGVLKLPCDVAVFEMVLKVVEEKRDDFFLHELELHLHAKKIMDSSSNSSICCCSPNCELTHSSHPQMCR